MIIVNNVVCGEQALKIPGHLSCGQYFLDRLREITDMEDRIALKNGDTGEKSTYKELLQETVNAAVGLKQLGTKSGVIVALFCENMPQFITACIGALCCGATITTIGVIYSTDEIKHVLNISQPTILMCSKFCLNQNYDTIKSISSKSKIIQLNGDPVDDIVIPYQRLLVDTNINEYEPTEVRGASDTAVILYSSGTTGLPKGVMLTHLNVLYAIANLDVEKIYAAEFSHVLTVIPWYHVYGLITTITYLIMRKMIVYLSRFELEKYLSTIQEEKMNILLSVPSIVVSIAKNPLASQYDLSSVKMVWCGAAPFNADITLMAMNRMPNCYGIYGIYGLTETTGIAVKDPEKYNFVVKPGSSGIPIPGIKIKVVDVNTRKKLGPNEEGEICVKGSIIMKGYLGNKTETRDTFDADGYLKSGDIGYYDHGGYLFIVDRLKELIKYKGHQVAPAIIERILLQHTGVDDCAVVGTPDEVAGELPTAYVVKKQGVTLTERELLEYTDTKLSQISRLRGGIIFTDSIPRNGSGKILRRQLKS